MKILKHVFLVALILINVKAIFSQSYLYNRGSSGGAITYSKIFYKTISGDAISLDATFLGRFSLGISSLLTGNKYLGFNGSINALKINSNGNTTSLPLFIGTQLAPGKPYSFGLGIYVKTKTVNDFAFSSGISYIKTNFSDDSKAANNFSIVNFEVVLFYKEFKFSPALVFYNGELSFAIGLGFAFGHDVIAKKKVVD